VESGEQQKGDIEKGDAKTLQEDGPILRV